MKHEIEIPDLPEGYEIGKPKVVYAHMGDDSNPIYISIPLKKKQPLRIVLEETGEIRINCYLLELDDGNLILPPGREYRIVEDNKCAE